MVHQHDIPPASVKLFCWRSRNASFLSNPLYLSYQILLFRPISLFRIHHQHKNPEQFYRQITTPPFITLHTWKGPFTWRYGFRKYISLRVVMMESKFRAAWGVANQCAGSLLRGIFRWIPDRKAAVSCPRLPILLHQPDRHTH